MVDYHVEEKGNFSMTNIVQTPVEEIELTDAQLEAVYGASSLAGHGTASASVDLMGNDTDGGNAPYSSYTSTDTSTPTSTIVPDTTSTPSIGGNTNILFFKKDKNLFVLKKEEKVKFLHIS
jgi:hypothetical protein